MKKLLLLSLFIGVLFAYQHPFRLDITTEKLNTLSTSSQEVLGTLQHPIHIELATTNPKNQEQLLAIIELFQRESAHIHLSTHHNPSETLILHYQNHQKTLALNPHWSEQTLAQAIHEVIQQHNQWVVFLTGHGEPDPFGQNSHDLGTFSAALRHQGFNLATLNLLDTPTIPSNTQTLVIANQHPLLAHEIEQIKHYLLSGGNLIWLVNPHSPPIPPALKALLSIEWPGGALRDPHAKAMGATDESISIIHQYPSHPITALNTLTVFPNATPLTTLSTEWQTLLTTHPTTLFNNIQASFPIAALKTQNTQRIAIVGNTEFLTNATIHLYGNQALALNLFHWINALPPLVVSTQSATTLLPPLWARFTIQYLFPALTFVYLALAWQQKRRRIGHI